jgi:hypothetical protein
MGAAILLFLKPIGRIALEYWKPIAIVVSILVTVFLIHHHGYNQGVYQEAAKYQKLVEAAKNKNAKLEGELANANRSLAARAESIITVNDKVAKNEKARADRVIADLRMRLRAGAGVPDPDAAARCIDVATRGADTAGFNGDAARQDAAKIDALQLYIGSLLKASGSPIPEKMKAQLAAAEARLRARETLSIDAK